MASRLVLPSPARAQSRPGAWLTEPSTYRSLIAGLFVVLFLLNQQSNTFAFIGLVGAKHHHFSLDDGPPDLPAPFLACVLVTVPANALIHTLSTEHAESDRMPAFLASEDWATRLGETGNDPTAAKVA